MMLLNKTHISTIKSSIKNSDRIFFAILKYSNVRRFETPSLQAVNVIVISTTIVIVEIVSTEAVPTNVIVENVSMEAERTVVIKKYVNVLIAPPDLKMNSQMSKAKTVAKSVEIIQIITATDAPPKRVSFSEPNGP